MKKSRKKILVTGCAGFIGFHICLELLKEKKYLVYGIDNLNNYYDKKLKNDRLRILKKSSTEFVFKKIDISDNNSIKKDFLKNHYVIIIHLAAQAGVRHSIANPEPYIKSNQVGFFNIIDAAKSISVEHFLYASSSSVYGISDNKIQTETDYTDRPISLYAATKKSNELVAHSYSHLFKLPSTAMRFFTVYGPFGRPDMSPHKFVNAVVNNKTVHINNFGNHTRDFTYIDDVTKAVMKLINKPNKNKVPAQIINIGCNNSQKISTFLKIIEKKLRKKAKIKYRKMQPGDVKDTHANIKKLKSILPFRERVSLDEGMEKFIDWYISYYKFE